jgi:hypothetical protein
MTKARDLSSLGSDTGALYTTGNAAYYNGVIASELAADFDPSVTPIMGAIIESGFNDNGSYTKFADGTLIQRLVYTASYGAGENITMTLPTALSTTALAWAGASVFPVTSDYSVTVAWVEDINTVRLRTQLASNNDIDVLVIGRWF